MDKGYNGWTPPYLNLGTSKTIFSLRERIGSNTDDK